MFTEEYSRFKYVFLIRRKYDALDKFIAFKAKSENFTTKEYRAKKCLELVYTDMCWPFNVHTRGEHE